jgi:hypothetical protein
MALAYYCKYNGMGFNGSCDCVWERKRRRREWIGRVLGWLRFRRRKRLIAHWARMGFTPMRNESFQDFERRVQYSLFRPRSETIV